MKKNNENILGYEFKNALMVRSSESYSDDLVVVKENIHFKNGDVKPNLRFIKNFKRPWYMTRESQRNHKDKKVWEHVDNLLKYECTQSELTSEISKRMFGLRGGLKTLNRSPYLYGTDVQSTVLIKHQYMTKFPDLKTFYKVAHLDIEFDVIDGTDSINMISVSCGSNVYQFITKQYVGTIPNFVEKVVACYEKEIPPLLAQADKETKQFKDKGIQHKFNLQVEVVEDEFEAIQKIFEILHTKEKPDILSIWNLPYDTKKMMQAIERKGWQPEEIFNDPSIPHNFKTFKLTEGQAKIFDANGVSESKDPCDRWHRVQSPGHFFWADQMSVRRAVRKHLNKEPSYALGNILYKEFGFGKLKGDAGIRSTGIDWHKHMQRDEKVFYCVYNMFDNIGAQLLDEKTLDLRSTFPTQCGFSDMQSYGSQGRKLADDMYFDLLDRGYVITGTSDQMEREWDKFLVPLDGWISTLSPHLIEQAMGKQILEDYPESFSKIIKWVLDIDVKSSYPSTGVWANLSQETTKRAMARIVGVTMEEQRRAGINLCAGRVNAVEIMTKIRKAPTQLQLLQRFCKKYDITLED